MESKQLKHFLAVAKHGNFTQAAKEIHIAQPALSISIKKFEQSLGVVLFRREEKRVSLTKEGEVLLVHAQRVIQQLHDATLAIDELKGLQKGEVRLGAPSMMGSYFFPRVVMAFKSQYPDLKLTLVEAGTRSIRKMLLEGELDLGVINCDDVPDDLHVDHLFTSQMVAVVGSEHELASKKTIGFEEFFEYELVMFKHGYFHRDFLDQVSEANGLSMRSSFETNLLPMILSIVKQEFAITALLDLVTEYESGIVGIPFTPPVTLDLGLAWRKQGYLSIADRTFIEFVKRYV
ncbi:LysR family transcriptional regulator [Vibrio breoganii]|uniref:LysR family transcriptional regulator n=1 Tax=Vibrio breoganii TaxID=553239 RepID=A0AAP8MVL3_9VIBR|nr:LysR family transcriptional regulator [Vibrio breoganii]NMO73082.1 LysR family transcriptional regulator [Vibrio breoganii]NMR69369.1 LysR family transcriptional regulator [Vibrio breoganii]OCH75858.1 LysR family transcriptional regulator [Vibrio breoganii]OED94351.1 LysR family transcriptional regulator [Vibrio breoganii ZF-29]OEF84437.1 LysR family transcriptional regulator [Vibrio breoganii 1C10]